MNTKPFFSCTAMPIQIEETHTQMINMRVDVGGSPLCSFMLKSRSLEEGNRLASLLNEAVAGILPVHRSW
jgi:hypothetical protein